MQKLLSMQDPMRTDMMPMPSDAAPPVSKVCVAWDDDTESCIGAVYGEAMAPYLKDQAPSNGCSNDAQLRICPLMQT